MKKTFAILGILQALLLGAFAQTAADPLEKAYLENDEVNQILRLKWWGKGGRTYFILHSDDLVNWNSFPVIETGADAIMEYGVAFTPTPTTKLFLRLKSTDIPTTDPAGSDFDSDNVSNLTEVQMGLDPLNADSDGDGMSDGWEIAHGLDPLVDDSGLDPDLDGIVNAMEFALGTSPTAANSDLDLDGVSDLTEIASGTKPAFSDSARNGNNPLGLIVYARL